MKKALQTFIIVCSSTFSFAADGIINFSNVDIAAPTGGGSYSPGVWGPGRTGSLNANSITGSPGGLGAGYTAGLFLQGSTTPLYTTGFYTDPGFEWAFDNGARSGDVTVTGVAPGATALLQIKIWATADGSYEAAAAAGHFRSSATDGLFISRPLGGPDPGGGPPFFTPQLTGFTGMLVPEPSTYALAMAGLGALALMRRR